MTPLVENHADNGRRKWPQLLDESHFKNKAISEDVFKSDWEETHIVNFPDRTSKRDQ